MIGRIFLFSGHMIDRPGRSKPRFPSDKEPIAVAAIDEALTLHGARGTDLGICGGAAGGDLIFAEACLSRGMRLDVYIPFAESSFVKESVTYAGDIWRDRYVSVTRQSVTRLLSMADDPFDVSPEMDPYTRNNRRMVDAALAYGPAHVMLLALWDGKAGDGPGGTRDMVVTIQARGGRIHILDASSLFANGVTS